MNERIKELAEQAFDTAEYPADQRYRIEPNSSFYKKFAELIVQECAALFHLTFTDEQYQRRIDKTIRKHFGVEE